MRTSFSLAAVAFALRCLASEPLVPETLAAEIKTEELNRVLWNLNKIANDNGGNRAFGHPGYRASVDFILERARDRFANEMDTFLQPFMHDFEATLNSSLKGPEGEDVRFIPMYYTPPTPLPGGITAELIDTPVNDVNGSMCVAADWNGIDATGKIALVKRGNCTIAEKLKGARAAGALAVVLYNQTPGTNYSKPSVLSENRDKVVPVGVTTLEIGQAWSKRLQAGEKLVVTMIIDSIYEKRETYNVIVETKEGDPNNVVMLGAHLDSVPEGPGINDDGSGTAALLEIMGAFSRFKGFKNKVRFGWWGAEEEGLVGSDYYTDGLSDAEADKIRYYFNYDMIGSINPTYYVFDGEKIGSNHLNDFLKKAGKNTTWGGFGASSDYVGFLNRGIPSSGLATGASRTADPCYHQACDTIDNINWEAITLNARAAAYAAAQLANSLEGIPARNRSAVYPPPRTAKRDLELPEVPLHEHVDTCEGGHKSTTI